MPHASRTFNSKHLTFDIRSIVNGSPRFAPASTKVAGEAGQLSMVRKASGFTLIELLVVISIIGILATFVVASFGGAQARGRDSRRKNDLDAIKKALSISRNDSSGGAFYLNATAGLAPTYMKLAPVDPSTNLAYPYTGLPSGCTGQIGAAPCTDFRLTTVLENTADPQAAPSRTQCPAAAGVPAYTAATYVVCSD